MSLEMEKPAPLKRIRLDETTIADVFTAGGVHDGIVREVAHRIRAGVSSAQARLAEFEGFFGSDALGYNRYGFDVQGTKREVTDRYLTDNLSERAIAFVRRHQRRPFFLHLAHCAPHRPLEAPAGMVKRYQDSGFERTSRRSTR